MKSMKVLLVLVFTFSLLAGDLYSAEKYVFNVLATSGKVEFQKKSSGPWKRLRTGTKLYMSDKVKIFKNAYLGMVHNTGKVQEVKKADEYSVQDLNRKVKKSSSVTGRFTQYVLDEMQESDNLFANDKTNMDVTGSVERGNDLRFVSGEAFMLNSARKVNLKDHDLTLNWFKVKDVNKYKLHLTDRFDREVKTFDVKDTTFTLSPGKLNLEKDVYYFWYVTVPGDKKMKSDDGCFMVYSDKSAKALKDSLQVLKTELGDLDNPISKVLVAYFYEKNSMIDEADAAYKEAIKLSGGVEDFQKMYDRFLLRIGVRL